MAISKPITRVEQYLAHISGMRVNVPEVPLTREEMYLAAWARKSGIEDTEMQGEPPLTLKDCIGEPFNGLVLYGKSTQVTTTGAQLLNLVDREPATICGLTWQIKNQCISVNGTTTDEGKVTDFYIYGGRNVYEDADFPEGEITISADLPKDIVMFVVKNDGTILTHIDSNKKDDSFEHILGSKYRIMFRVTKKGAIYDNVIKAMFNRGGTPLPWEPYTGGKPSPSPDYPQEIVSAKGEVVVHGKNIFGGRYYYAMYTNGILLIDKSQKDKEVKFPYQPEAETRGICKVLKCQKGKTYVISVTNPNKNATIGMAEYENIENAYAHTKNVGFAKMTTKTKQLYTAKSDGILVCGIAGTWTDGKTTVHECTESELLQVEEASEATSYEPYHNPQTLTLSAPNGLPGIMVTSGGNYTDENGQQWICDELDFERGVYRQRIGCKEYLDASGWKHSITSKFKNHNFQTRLSNSDTSAGINGRCYCNLLSYKNTSWDDVAINLPKIYAHDTEITVSFPPDTNMDSIEKWDELLKKTSLQIQYILETTIETPLSEADIAAYRALTTYKGTTILESECYLKVKYSKLRK